MQAAADVIRERGYEAATMSEIASRADTRVGALYRFFPSKEAIGDALMASYSALLADQYATLREQAARVSPEQLADLLIEQLVRLHPQTRAVVALLDFRTEWTVTRRDLRALALREIAAALQLCAAGLDDEEAEDIAAVILNNQKTMVGIVLAEAPTSRGAPDEMRLMNRIYLARRLAPQRGA